MTTIEIFFMMLSLAMAFAASVFAYDCKKKEEEIKNQRKEISFLREVLKQSLLSSTELSITSKKDFGGEHGKGS